MTPKSIVFLFFLTLFSSFLSFSQYGISHEAGIIVGPEAFRSDFGQRKDAGTNSGNTGLGVGLVHYVNFSYSAKRNLFNYETYFNDHFKIRSELSYNTTKLNHFGQYAEGNNSLGKQQLRGMYGKTTMINFGMQLEYYPLSIRDFTEKNGSFAPYVSLGAQYSLYNANVQSTLGELGNTATTYPKYLTPSGNRLHGYSTERGTVASVVTSLGVRYKLAEYHDLLADARAQYYFSDWVDGLNPTPELYKENRSNDWMIWFTVGYVYYLEW